MQQPMNRWESPLELMQSAAVGHALAGEWADAIRANQKLIEANPDDIEARNRLGKAYASLGKASEAISAYKAVLVIAPHNRIAQNNLSKLESLGSHGEIAMAGGAAMEMQRASSSVRGASVITRLSRVAGDDVIESVAQGEILDIAPSPVGIRISTRAGKYLGVINTTLSGRIARLIIEGNKYEVYATHIGPELMDVTIVECFKSAKLINVASFPARYQEAFSQGTIEKYDLSEVEQPDETLDSAHFELGQEEDEGFRTPSGTDLGKLSGDLEPPTS
jgi:tetratricopeptide (TPR) repeat protein